MAIRWGNPAASYKVGDIVECCRIGARDAFVGKVVARLWGGRYYHVRDAAGNDWHRTSRDMRRVDTAQDRAAI